MGLTVDGIFSAMPELFRVDKAVGVTASVAYKVTGAGGGDYTCIITDGVFSLAREIKADAQATVTISAEDWIALNEGRLDPMAAYMSGKLKGAGDLGLLQKFPRFFKRPENDNGSGIPLNELMAERIALLAAPLQVSLGSASFGSGPLLSGEEGSLRALVEGRRDPGASLLGGRLLFEGDMAVLRGAWTAWSAAPVTPRKPKRPGKLQLLGMWLKSKFGG